MRKKSQSKVNHFQYSLTHLGIFFAAILMLVVILQLSFVSSFWQEQLRQQYLNNALRLQMQFNDEQEATFSILENQLILLGDKDAALLNITDDDMVLYRVKMSVFMELSSLSQVFPEIDGLFYYAPSPKDFTPFVHRVATNECAVFIRETLDEASDNIASLGKDYQKWQLHSLADDDYLVRFIVSGSGVLGAWISLTSLTESFQTLFEDGCIVTFLDQTGTPIKDWNYSDFTLNTTADSGNQQYRSADGTDYLVIYQKTSYSDCYLAVFTPLSLIVSHLTPVYRAFLLITILIILGVLAVLLTLRVVFQRLVRPLQQALTVLQRGEQRTVRLNTSSACREIHSFLTILNSMLDDMQTLETRVFEDKLAQSRLESKFLKSQLSPHFLVNCLDTFSFLATSDEENDHAAAQRLTQVLSQHIRYTFTSEETIPLIQEFDHLDNYLDLACIRYPDTLSYQLTLSPDCEQSRIPPMTLMTLCENTIKHNLIMGERLCIQITASLENTPEPYVHICYIDSGTGYTQEMLERVNRILENDEYIKDGQHIGIYNIVKSLSLIYPGKSSFIFSNEPGGGARADIRIPYERIEQP